MLSLSMSAQVDLVTGNGSLDVVRDGSQLLQPCLDRLELAQPTEFATKLRGSTDPAEIAAVVTPHTDDAITFAGVGDTQAQVVQTELCLALPVSVPPARVPFPDDAESLETTMDGGLPHARS